MKIKGIEPWFLHTSTNIYKAITISYVDRGLPSHDTISGTTEIIIIIFVWVKTVFKPFS